MQLSLANVINISVSQAQQGLGRYNTSNLALFTTDAYASSFGSAGFSIYLEPSQVGSDFGTDSETFAMANQVFSQQPNILANSGYLVVIPIQPATENMGFSAAPASGSFSVVYGSDSAVINWNDSPSVIQAAIQSLTGLEQATTAGSIGSGSTAVVITTYGVYGSPGSFNVTGNTLQTSGSGSVTVTFALAGSAETLGAAITRTKDLVQYFGIMENLDAADMGSADVLAAAAVVQPLNKLWGVVSNNPSDLGTSGLVSFLTESNFYKTRSLFYGGSKTAALGYLASYLGRALSTNFTGANTTSTMHLKDMIGVAPDPSMTQTLLNQAQAAGADCYISLQGVPKVFTSGANQFFDQVYNLLAYVGDLQIAGFNYLAQSSTKVPQTEAGMVGFKGAYRAICEQYVTNGYLAPGAWNSSTTFGNQVAFFDNISSLGYYIFSQAVALQNAAARAAREAPLVQIAGKEAGAIQSGNVVVFINP